MENRSGMKPLHKFVLLRSDPPKKISAGGVQYVNEQRDDKSAVIVAIGPDAFEGWNNPPQEGDRVLHFGAIAVADDPDGGAYYLASEDKLAVTCQPLTKSNIIKI